MTSGQLASLSQCQAPIWGPRPDFFYWHSVVGLLMWGALFDKRTCLLFTVNCWPSPAQSFSWIIARHLWIEYLYQLRNVLCLEYVARKFRLPSGLELKMLGKQFLLYTLSPYIWDPVSAVIIPQDQLECDIIWNGYMIAEIVCQCDNWEE
jgi:hypothetical protein